MNPGPPDLSPLNPAPIKLWGVIVTIDGNAASGSMPSTPVSVAPKPNTLPVG